MNIQANAFTLLCGLSASAALFAQPAAPVFKTILPSTVFMAGELNGTFYGWNGGLFVSLTPPTAPGGSWTETTLYQFQNAYVSSLLMTKGPEGLPVFYGLTIVAGFSDNLDAFFSLTPPASPGGSWTETDLYSFAGVDGNPSNPGALALGANGVFYGVTQSYAASVPATVFSLTPPAAPGDAWTEEVIQTFSHLDGDAIGPVLVAEGLGGTPVLYGANPAGGTVYELTPPPVPGDPWKQTVLASGLPGPEGPLAIGKDGILYGTTDSGGPYDFGTVYSLRPPAQSGSSWTEEVLYELLGASGATPDTGVVIGEGGVLYGTTMESGGLYPGGAVFSLTPPSETGEPWTPTVIHTFTDAEEQTVGGLIRIGALLYGNTRSTTFAIVP